MSRLIDKLKEAEKARTLHTQTEEVRERTAAERGEAEVAAAQLMREREAAEEKLKQEIEMRSAAEAEALKAVRARHAAEEARARQSAAAGALEHGRARLEAEGREADAGSRNRASRHWLAIGVAVAAAFAAGSQLAPSRTPAVEPVGAPADAAPAQGFALRVERDAEGFAARARALDAARR